MKTKLLKPIWLAAMLLLLSSVPLTANAHDFEVGGIYYLIDGTNATVTFRGSSYNEYSNEYSGNVVIPESVTYNGSTYSVTSIGPYAFRDCSGLTRVTIGNSVTSIGKYAFYNCTGLTSVTIPNSVTSIGNNAFYKCSGLTSITIPNSVTSIGDYAFQNCSGLTGELVIPNSVTSIGNNAFNRCSGLTSVTIGNSVTSIGNYAFYQCSGLTSVTIGNSVTSIGYGAFYGCSGLTSVNIPNSVTSIGISAFSHCSGLTSVTIGNSVTSIGDYAFAYCSGLTGELVIPNSVTSIGNYAFSGCSGLTSVTIPNLVTSIGSSAFQGCSGLTRVETLIENPASVLLGSNVFSSINPLCKLVVPHGTINAYRQADQWKNFLRIIDDTFDPTQYIEFEDQEVERICINNWDSDGDGFLSYNEAASVTSLGEVFKDNETITSFNELQYFTGLTSIGNYAFNNCSGLTSITIPNSVTSIGERAFYRCSGLTSIDIPNSVISIGKDAFQLCSGLTSVHITDLAAWCNITFGDNLANPLYYAHHLFLNGAEVTDLVIPNSVTSIGNSAFQGCSGLTSVTIPNSVTSIGYNAFIECSGLESIVVENGNSTYDSRDNCNAIIETATNTLISGCKNTIIPNSVTSIGSSAFSRCTGLTSVTIPNSVTSIGDVAFQQCYGLTSVTIPNSVTSIGNYAFNYCGGLTSIYNHINHPTNVTLGSNVFYGVSKTNCTLYVTAGRVNEYRNANQWKDFVNIVEGDWLGDISFENDFLTLYLGETDTLQVQLTPASAPYPTLLWQSSDTTVATVDQNGRITPITLGQTVITATTTTTDDGLNLSASCTVYVRAHVSSISLDKDSTILYLNETDTLTATVLPEFAYNKVVNWTSSDANVATVDQNGVVTAHAVGNAIITATTTDGTSLSDSCLVEVRAYATGITLDKTQTSIYVGGNDSIAATVLPENAYNKTLLWQSSDTTVATVDQNGKVTAVALGQAVITASTTDGTNLSASCQVNVTGITSIALNKTSTNIYVSGTETLTASIVPSDVIINTLQWQSSDTTVATVDQNGKVTAVALGQAVITAMAADGSGVSASCQVNVTGITRVTLSNSSAILYLNNTQQLYATITPSDVIVKTLVWQSSDPAVATVDQNGKVTAHTVGTAIITATTTDGTNLSASCVVEVRAYVSSVTLDKTRIDTYVGGSETITATVLPENAYNRGLQWQSSNLSVASVDQNGKVTATGLGTAIIVAKTTDGTNLMATCEVNVTGVTSLTLDESDITLFAGTSQTLVATISPSDVIVSTLQWQSSDPTVATVNQNGKVVALAAGTATITATTTDGTNLSASCQVTVWPQYALAAPGIEHTRGEQSLVVEYAVEMFNKNAITGLQFEMQLPDSISLMDDSYGYPDIWLDENRRARNHSVDVTELGDNYYKVMISSPTNKEFKGNSGNLFYMRLLVDKYHASGIYNIGLTGIVLAEPDETEHQVDDTSFDVQYNYMLGDADADVRVDVGDYITTALYIMNRPTLRFYEDAANVHTANDAINVTDLTGITNIALGIRPTEILHAPALGDAALADNNEPELGVSVKRLDADRWMMSVDLSNRQPMAAMQLDLQLPDGVSYESASLTERAGKLQLTDGILPDGTLRLLMSAFSADDIEAGEGDVINIVLKGNPVAGGMATFHNMIVAERNLNSYEPEPMMVPFVPTAIDGATLYNEVRIYGEKGNVVIESPVAGTAQLVLLNGIATPLEVQPGRNTYPVNSNEYYIVRFNGVTAKLRF